MHRIYFDVRSKFRLAYRRTRPVFCFVLLVVEEGPMNYARLKGINNRNLYGVNFNFFVEPHFRKLKKDIAQGD